MHFSAIILLATEEDAQKALSIRVTVIEMLMHTVKCTDKKSYNQCLKC